MGNQHTNDIYKEYFPNKPANIKGINDLFYLIFRTIVPSVLSAVEIGNTGGADGGRGI